MLSLESKANDTKVKLDKVKNPACNKCQSRESKIVELKQVIEKYEKGQLGLKNVLSRQRYSNDKYGLGICKLINQVHAKLYVLKLAINSTMWNQRKCTLQFKLRRLMLEIINTSIKIIVSSNL